MKEIALSKINVEEAQEIIVEDKIATRDLGGWLVHGQDLIEAEELVMTIDVEKDTKKSLSEFFYQISDVLTGTGRTRFIRKILGLFFTAGIVKYTPQEFWQLASVLSIWLTIMIIQNRNRMIFDCISLLFKGSLAILSLTNACVDAAEALTSKIMYRILISKDVNTALVEVSFAALSLSLDAAIILLLSIHISNGSMSDEGKKILKVVEKMKEETETFTGHTSQSILEKDMSVPYCDKQK